MIGIVGAIRPEKNQARLLRAFERAGRLIPEAELLIIGDGPLMSTLKAAASASPLGTRVHFTGSVLDPSSYYRAMDILALTSDTEQMPLTILEGMATGLPIVSTDVGDVRHMVCSENQRFVVPAADETALAQGIVEMAGNIEARQSLGRLNREKCERDFDRRVMLRAYTDLYRELLDD